MVDGNDEGHQDQDNGDAVVAGQLVEEENHNGQQHGQLHHGQHHGINGQVVLLGVLAGLQLAQYQQHTGHRGNNQADEIHAGADLDGGQEAGADPVVGSGQGALGLGLQDDVAQAAAHQHGGQGDDEGGDVHIGNEEAHEDTEQSAHGQSGSHGGRCGPAEVNDQGAGHGAGGSDHGANAQVHVAGQNTQQHTDGQDDHVAVLHDQVIDVHGGQVLALGDDGEEQVNHNQHDHHAVLLQTGSGLFKRLVLCHYASTSSFLLWAMMQDIMASWVIWSPESSPAISPSLMT